MQKVLIGLLAATTAVLAVVCAVQWKQLHAARDQNAATEMALQTERQAREAKEGEARALQAAKKRADEQIQQFANVTGDLRSKEAKQASNLTALAQMVKKSSPGGGAPGEAGKGGMFGKDMGEMLKSMMKDPAMREMLQSQQKAMIGQMYGGLFKELNLGPEDKDKLSKILTDAQMKNMEAAQGMFGETKDDGGTALKESQAAIEQAKKQTDAELKALLGDQGFAKYEDYQKNVQERMQLDQLKTNLEAAKLPLQDQQSAQLLQIMKDEKAAVPPVIPSDQGQVNAHLKEIMTAENVDKQLQWLEDYNRRVAEKAAAVLSADQLKQYKQWQEQQLNMQKLGLKMARGMFGGEGQTGGAAPN